MVLEESSLELVSIISKLDFSLFHRIFLGEVQVHFSDRGIFLVVVADRVVERQLLIAQCLECNGF